MKVWKILWVISSLTTLDSYIVGFLESFELRRQFHRHVLSFRLEIQCKPERKENSQGFSLGHPCGPLRNGKGPRTALGGSCFSAVIRCISSSDT